MFRTALQFALPVNAVGKKIIVYLYINDKINEAINPKQIPIN